MKIAYFPYTCKANQYIKLMQECMENNGENEIVDFNCIDSTKEYPDVVILNWYENLRTKKIWYGIAETRKRIEKVYNLKKHGCKIVYVLHNKKVHGDIFCFWSTIIVRRLFEISDKIIILSKDSIRYFGNYTNNTVKAVEKAVYIPHPNYISTIQMKPDCEQIYTRANLGISDKTIVYLFFGMIKPYKNIEMILDIANECKDKDVHFIIAGKPESIQYAEKLRTRIKCKDKVTTLFEFIPDDNIFELINVADVVLLPYDITSSLNSGTVYLAFSCRKTVICPTISTIKDCPAGLTFSYTYRDKREHQKCLMQKIDDFYKKFYTNRNKLEILNDKVFNYVEENHSLEQVRKQCEMLLNNI